MPAEVEEHGATGRAAPSDWVSLHAYYHGDLDVLLVEGVRPLLAFCAERGLARDAFFVRYWNGGRHVRLRLRPPRRGAAAELLATAGARLQDYLDRRPGPAMSSAEYWRSVDRFQLGRLHGEEVLPLESPNTVLCVPYVFEEERYGGAAARAVVEAHFCHSSTLALEVVSRLAPRARLSWVMDAMAAAGSCLPGGSGAVAALFTSYFEASWMACAPGFDDPPRAGYRPYSETRGCVQASLARAAAAPPGGAVAAWCAGWRAHVEGTLSQLAACRDGRSGATAGSVLASMLHMLNNRIGVAPQDEAYIAWVLGNAFAESAGSRDRAPPDEGRMSGRSRPLG